MLITQVIEAGIKWLLSLLIPGAGFIKAIMAIKDVIVFFVESAIMLIPALIEGILALAAGSVARVAKAIEFGLARLLPLVIGLFAKLIGLGGLSKKVMKIFTNIRKRVDKAVTKLLMKAKVAGQKILRKLGIGKKGDKKKKETDAEIKDSGGIRPEEFSMAGSGHTLSVKKGKIHMASSNPGELIPKLTSAKKEVEENPNAPNLLGKGEIVLGQIDRLIKVTNGVNDKFSQAKKPSDKSVAQGQLDKLAKLMGKFGNDYKLKSLEQVAASKSDEISLVKGAAFSIRPKKNWYAAAVEVVKEPKRTFDYKFAYEKYRAGISTMTFDDFDKKSKDGTISKMEPSRYAKLVAEAKKHDEPLRSLILGTIGGYRDNLIGDLQKFISAEGGESAFRAMYKNARDAFKAKVDALIGANPVTKDDLKKLFEGFEAHHVIPANFLRNNSTVQKLLKQLKQIGIEFGYNNLDNLIFIPAGNHTQGEQRGHPEYDREISERINDKVAPLVEQGNYVGALDALKKIVNQVKKKFIDEIIGSDKTAKNI